MGTLGAVRFLPGQENRHILGLGGWVFGTFFPDGPATQFGRQYYRSVGRGLSNAPLGGPHRHARLARWRPQGVGFGGSHRGEKGWYLRHPGKLMDGTGLGSPGRESAFCGHVGQEAWGCWVGRGAEKLGLGPIFISSPVPRGAAKPPPNAPPPFFRPGWRAAGAPPSHQPPPATPTLPHFSKKPRRRVGVRIPPKKPSPFMASGQVP